MKTKLILFLIFFVFFFDCFGQYSKNIDSLKSRYLKAPDDQKTILHLAQFYESKNQDSALYFANLLLEKSKKDPRLLAGAYQTKANVAIVKNQDTVPKSV